MAWTAKQQFENVCSLKFDILVKQMEQTNKSLEQANTSLGKIERKVYNGLEDKVDGLSNRITSIESRIDKTNSKLDSILIAIFLAIVGMAITMFTSIWKESHNPVKEPIQSIERQK